MELFLLVIVCFIALICLFPGPMVTVLYLLVLRAAYNWMRSRGM